jgi:hypothetical protein
MEPWQAEPASVGPDLNEVLFFGGLAAFAVLFVPMGLLAFVGAPLSRSRLSALIPSRVSAVALQVRSTADRLYRLLLWLGVLFFHPRPCPSPSARKRAPSTAIRRPPSASHSAST